MVDKKITELDASTSLGQTDVFPVVDIGSSITKKITIANIETGLAISGALVTDIANLVTVSGAGVVVSGATVTNKNNLATVSGASLVVSGAYVVTSGTLVTVSGAGVTASGAGATHEADTSNPHGATLTQTNISSTGLISGTTLTGVVGDHAGSASPELVNVVYSTSSTTPTASNTTEGTLFVQYTA